MKTNHGEVAQVAAAAQNAGEENAKAAQQKNTKATLQEPPRIDHLPPGLMMRYLLSRD
jgi:hypothetical protein